LTRSVLKVNSKYQAGFMLIFHYLHAAKMLPQLIIFVNLEEVSFLLDGGRAISKK